MGALLDWKPQEAFADFFYTTAEEILSKRTVFREELTYFVPYGGRGSAKSFTFIDACVVEASIRPVRILCTREIQISIDESVKAEIEAAIVDRELEHFFKITDNKIEGLNGSRFIFKGIKNNIKNLKSISDVDIVLCEESEDITKNSWEKLLPSIRPRKPFGGRGKRPINIIIFNPNDELDDTYQRFIISPPPRSCVRLINWRDNKYFPENLEELRQHSLKTRPKKDHEHDWEGKPISSCDNVIIDREWIRAARFASRKTGFEKVGLQVYAYDPAGQGKDSNAKVYADGNIVKSVDEWVKSDDLREASKRAFSGVVDNNIERFVFDTCGGLGDGVEVFIADEKKAIEKELGRKLKIDIFPFDAGAAVVDPDKKIPGTNKKWKDMYSNAKAQEHAITAQKLYNSYRFVKLGEKDIEPGDMLSIDIDDDDLFNKIVKELSAPIWVKSATNSKKKVESKEAMKKRTGLPSPNIGDSIHMLSAPRPQARKVRVMIV
jgi:phage terminase large subunit